MANKCMKRPSVALVPDVTEDAEVGGVRWTWGPKGLRQHPLALKAGRPAARSLPSGDAPARHPGTGMSTPWDC